MPYKCGVAITLLTLALTVPKVFGNSGGAIFHIANDHNDDHPTTARYPELARCSNLSPQHSLDVTEILGLWYGSEIIIHSDELPSVYKYNFCVNVFISDITEQMQHAQNAMRERQYKDSFNNNNNNRRYETHQNYPQYEDVPLRYLRLVWTENDKNLEYVFNYTLSSPGIWHNSGEQRGSLATRPDYKQFKGNVQVLKAVNDHMVLTFCGTDAYSSVYTLVLSRSISGLNPEELRSIRNLLSRRYLNIGRIGKVCASSAATTATANTAAAAVLLVCALIARRAI